MVGTAKDSHSQSLPITWVLIGQVLQQVADKVSPPVDHSLGTAELQGAD